MAIARIVAIVLLLMQVANIVRCLLRGFWRSPWYLIQALAWLLALLWAVIYPSATLTLLLVLLMAVVTTLGFRAHLKEQAEREKRDSARARLQAVADANEFELGDLIRERLKESDERDRRRGPA